MTWRPVPPPPPAAAPQYAYGQGGGAGGSVGGGGSSGASVSLVQKAVLRTSKGATTPTTTLTLPAAPTPGNILVFVSSGFGLPSVAGATTVGTYSADSQWIYFAWRAVQSGDSAAWTFSGVQYSVNQGVFEFNGAHKVSSGPSSPTISGSVLSAPMFSAIAGGYTLGAIEQDNSLTLSSISGASVLLDGGDTLNNHAGWIFTYEKATLVKLTLSGTGNLPVGAACYIE